MRNCQLMGVADNSLVRVGGKDIICTRTDSDSLKLPLILENNSKITIFELKLPYNFLVELLAFLLCTIISTGDCTIYMKRNDHTAYLNLRIQIFCWCVLPVMLRTLPTLRNVTVLFCIQRANPPHIYCTYPLEPGSGKQQNPLKL